MSSTSSDTQASEESLEDEFAEERRNRTLIGIGILIVAILATIGIFWYFGAASAMAW
jgi:uncharacterized membrane protein